MSGDRRAAGHRTRRAPDPGPPAEPTADDLERLAAELVRELGVERAPYLAALIDEAVAEAAEAG
jgi:hypothetical protein